jgi:hypothetical protein
MKLSKSKLKQIIREELRKTLHEEEDIDWGEISSRTDHRLEALEIMVDKLRLKIKALEGQPAKKTNATYEPWE